MRAWALISCPILPPSLINHTVSVDVKHHERMKYEEKARRSRAQELCESRGGRPGLPVHNGPYGLCGRWATFNSNSRDGSQLRTV